MTENHTVAMVGFPLLGSGTHLRVAADGSFLLRQPDCVIKPTVFSEFRTTTVFSEHSSVDPDRNLWRSPPLRGQAAGPVLKSQETVVFLDRDAI